MSSGCGCLTAFYGAIREDTNYSSFSNLCHIPRILCVVFLSGVLQPRTIQVN